MLCHYPDPFNIFAIKAGFSDERREKSAQYNWAKQTTTAIIIIARY